ncbi:LacI family DNA-binding transcriptional regulator [Microbacterium halophytorum]|uniref:LacI family DNA-binding transcriptional regulator n=1 Tax=Microbacterium halophytorum TaxID=2067568 RepID=UPI000CFCB3A5|nr:LacI family DNA-binding transcriptional regulator [Microbacterium halophytorum]
MGAAPGPVTIADVAREAGVSTATVSRVLNGTGPASPDRRERVLAATKRLGYVTSASAASLASGRSRNVGVVVPRLGSWFFASVVEGAQSELLRAGYDLTLYNLRDGGELRDRVFADLLRRQRVDGVIAVSLELGGDEVSSLLSVGKPVVGLGGDIAGIPTFELDNVAVAREATAHLIGLGHRRIAHLGCDPGSPTAFGQIEKRYDGYADAMRAAELAPQPNAFSADFTVAGGYAVGRRMLEDPVARPTAVFAASDEMAIGLMLAARDLGVDVPRELSVVGVDDHELSAPMGLTTVAQAPEQQGAVAAARLIAELGGDSAAAAPDSLTLPHALVVRTSSSEPYPTTAPENAHRAAEGGAAG